MILRETQNQNDADDANDAESGIWYRDILKTASLASSASLSSHKSSEGVWGTPQKCVCGYPNAMLAKHVYPKTMTNKPDTRTNSYMLSRVNHFWFIQKSWLEKVNPFWFTFPSAAIIPFREGKSSFCRWRYGNKKELQGTGKNTLS